MASPEIAATPRMVAPILLLALGVTGSVCLRVLVSGWTGAASSTGGLVFTAALLGAGRLVSAATTRGELERAGDDPAKPLWSMFIAVAATLLLAGVPLAVHLRTGGHPLPVTALPAWAAVVALVATSEEWVFRGVGWRLLGAVDRWGQAPRIVILAVAFALMHVPFYGWRAVPVDFAAGLVLGFVRAVTGRWQACAATHLLADLAGWWLR